MSSSYSSGLFAVEHSGVGAGIPWYLRLWAAVVRRAAVDWVLYHKHEVLKLRKIGADAGQWIFHDDSDDSVCSFIIACDILSLDPELVRSKVTSLTEEDARRLRGMEFGDEW